MCKCNCEFGAWDPESPESNDLNTGYQAGQQDSEAWKLLGGVFPNSKEVTEYAFELRKAYTGLGDTHVFSGPGLGRFCSEVHLVQDSAAEGQARRVAEMLDAAFEAGRDSMREEFRRLLRIR